MNVLNKGLALDLQEGFFAHAGRPHDGFEADLNGIFLVGSLLHRHLVLLPGAEIQGILHPHGADDISFVVNRQIGSDDELNAHDGVQGAVRFTQGCKAEIGLLQALVIDQGFAHAGSDGAAHLVAVGVGSVVEDTVLLQERNAPVELFNRHRAILGRASGVVDRHDIFSQQFQLGHAVVAGKRRAENAALGGYIQAALLFEAEQYVVHLAGRGILEGIDGLGDGGIQTMQENVVVFIVAQVLGEAHRKHPALEVVKFIQNNVLHAPLLLVQFRGAHEAELLKLARQAGLDHAEAFQAGSGLLDLLLPLVVVGLLIKIGDGKGVIIWHVSIRRHGQDFCKLPSVNSVVDLTIRVRVIEIEASRQASFLSYRHYRSVTD